MDNFWRDKKVLVTGHTGFKGVWLITWLDMLGAVTLGYSLDCFGVFNAAEMSGRHVSVYGDVRDRTVLEKEIRDFCPEIVFHLAAQSMVGVADKEPALTFETNLMGTVNLLDCLTDTVKACVIVTSDKVYANVETLTPYREDDRLGGDEPYAASKAAAELAALAYSKRRRIATARASNVYGGGDLNYDRLIPALCLAKIKNEPVRLRNPDAVRPWQYVLSPLLGYMKLARALYHDPAYSGGWNFGPPEDELVTVAELYSIIAGGTAETARSGFYEAGLLLIDSSKSRERLGWAPVTGLADGLVRTLDFYEKMLGGQPAGLLIEREIEKMGAVCI